MKKTLTTLAIITSLFALAACKPGVYMGPGANGTTTQNQNMTVLGEAAPVPTASPAN